MLAARKRFGFEETLVIIALLLAVFALALRITKVTGDLELAKRDGLFPANRLQNLKMIVSFNFGSFQTIGRIMSSD